MEGASGVQPERVAETVLSRPALEGEVGVEETLGPAGRGVSAVGEREAELEQQQGTVSEMEVLPGHLVVLVEAG